MPIIAFFIAINLILQAAFPLFAANLELADDQQASIDKAPNDVPLVNINRPNANGLSHNKYRQFNVGREGLILNNSTKIAESQLGGVLYANPNFNGQAARVILNEVTGNDRSQLLGGLEVFGERADLIIANPQGITCNGCGFINTDRLSLATGRPEIIDGELAAIKLGNGDLRITGAFDASDSKILELISKATQISNHLHAGGSLKLYLGDGNFNYQQAELTSQPGSEERFAVDVAELGGIYANSIYIIGTKDGFGVNNAGKIVAADDLIINAQGHFVTKDMVSDGALEVTAEEVKITGSQRANQQTITTRNLTVEESAELYASTDITLQIEQDLNNYGEIRADQQLSNRPVNGKLTEQIDNYGKLVAGQKFDLTAEVINNQLDGRIEAGLVDDQGNLLEPAITDYQSSLMATDQLVNRGYLASPGKLKLAAQHLTNDANSSSEDSGADNGQIMANNLAIMTDFTNWGSLKANHLTITNDNFSNYGLIKSLISGSITSHSIINHGEIEGGSSLLSLVSQAIDNNWGKIEGENSLSLMISGNQLNGRYDFAEQISLISSGQLSNNAWLIARDIIVNLAGDLTNTGVLTAQRNLTIELANHDLKNDATGELAAKNQLIIEQVNNLTNQGDLIWGSEPANRITLAGNFANHHLANGAGSLLLEGVNFSNAGQLAGGDQLALKFSDELTNQGTIFALGDLLLAADLAIKNQAGTLKSLGNIMLQARSGGANRAISNEAGEIIASGDMEFLTNHFVNRANDVPLKVFDYQESQDFNSKVAYAEGVYEAGPTRWWWLQLHREPFNDDYHYHMIAYDHETGPHLKRTIDHYQINPALKPGKIKADGNLTIEVSNPGLAASDGEFVNDLSRIEAGQDLTINATKLYNNSRSIYDKVRHSCHVGGGCDVHVNGSYRYKMGKNGYLEFAHYPQLIGAYLQAGGNLIGTVRSELNSQTVSEEVPLDKALIAEESVTSSAHQSAYQLSNEGPDLAAGDYGIFSRNQDFLGSDAESVALDQTYLFKSNLGFLDLDSFLGSNYFCQRTGLCAETEIRVVGDSFYERELISDMAFAAGFALGHDYNDFYQELTANTASWLASGVEVGLGVSLKAEQMAALQSDIIWYVYEEIAGVEVLVPKIYLASNGQRALAKEASDQPSLIGAGGALRLASEQINLSDSALQAGGDLTLLAGSSLKVSGSDLVAGQDLNLISEGELSLSTKRKRYFRDGIYSQGISENYGGLSAGNNLQIIATQAIEAVAHGVMVAGDAQIFSQSDIMVSSAVSQIAGDYYLFSNGDISYESTKSSEVTGENIREALTNRSGLSVTGNLSLIADGAISMIGASVMAGGNAYLEAGSGVDITSLSLRNRRATFWDKGHEISDSTSHLASQLVAGGDLTIVSDGAIKVEGSDLAAGSNLSLTASDEIKITSSQARAYYDFRQTSGGGGLSGSKTVSITTNQLTNRASNLLAGGDIRLNSQQDLSLIASRAEARGELSLIAAGSLNLLSDSDVSSYQEIISKSGIGSSSNYQRQEARVRQVGSYLTGDQLVLLSGQDSNIVGSQLSAATDLSLIVGRYQDADNNWQINQAASLNILNAKDSDYRSQYYQRSQTDLAAVALGGVTGGLGGLYMGSQTERGDIHIKENYDETIIASDLTAGNKLDIRSASEINIISSNLSSELDNISVIAGSLIDADNNLVITDREADINIASAVEIHHSFEQRQKLRADYTGLAVASMASGVIGGSLGPLGWLASGGMAANSDNFRQKSQLVEASQRQVLQIASNLNSGNDILSHSQNDTNIIASNLTAEHDVMVTANDQLNLTSASELSINSQSSSNRSFLSSAEELLSITNLSNKSSKINSGNNLIFQSGGDTNLISSDIRVGTQDAAGNLIRGGDASLIAGKYIDENGVEHYNETAKLNIAAAQEVQTRLYKSEKMSFQINDLDEIAQGALSIYGPAGALLSAYRVEYQDRENTVTNTINKGSNINVANNLITNSASNTNLVASNLNVGNDALIVAGTMEVNGVEQVNENANINIISAKDIIVSEEQNDQLILANDIAADGDVTAGTYQNKSTKTYIETNVASIIQTGNHLALDSSNDINIIGSDILSGSDVNLTAGRKVNILAAQNNSNSSTNNLSGELGVELTLDANEISVGASASLNYTDENSENVRQSSANILANNIFVNSQDDINLLASNLYAENDVNLTSTEGDINLLSAYEMSRQELLDIGLEVGVTAGISHDIGNTIDSLKGLADIDIANVTGFGQAGAVIDMVGGLLEGDNIDEMLEGNEQVINDISNMLNAGSTGGSAGIILSVQATADKTTSESNQALGSLIRTGNDINIVSTQSDVEIAGSALIADGDAKIMAGNNLDIIASNSDSSFKNVGGSLALELALYGTGFSLGGELHGAKNSNNIYHNAIVNADNIDITTGNNTSVKGANIEAKTDLALNVGGNLDIQSLQNTSKERSFAVGGGYGTINNGESYSANIGYSQGDSKWVDEQTRLTGGNAVDIIVGENTNLIGAVIANQREELVTKINPKTQETETSIELVDGGNLNLVTNSLTYLNLADKAKARSFSVSGNYSNRETTESVTTNSNGSVSGGLNYSMHDKQQATNATIGFGDILVGGVNTNTDKTLVAGLNRDINKSQVITQDLSVDPIEVSGTIRWDDEKGRDEDYASPIASKISEWKAIAKNPLKPFEDNFRDITSDLSVITEDMRNSGQANLASGIDNLTNQVGNGYWYGKDRAYDGVSATVRAISDNVTANGNNSTIASLYNENRNISTSIANFQNNREQTNDTYGLTNLNPDQVNQNLQLIADNHAAYNPDAHDGEVILYQDSTKNSPEAFAYSNKGLETININTAKTDLTNSGEVVNKVYHEGYNFAAHSANEDSAVRYGNYAENRWNDIGERNNYQNSNRITSNQWNQQYTVANNQNLAVGTTKSYVQTTYGKENVNNFFTPETAWDVANIGLGSVSLYKNLKDGNYTDAIVDAVGVVLDTGSAVIPALPGGYSSGIKASRSGDKVVNLIVDAANKKLSVQKDKILSNINDSKIARESSGFKEFSSNADNIGSGGGSLRNGGPGNNSPNRPDFYVNPKGEAVPGTAYRYMDSNSPEAIRALKNGSGELRSYFGFEKFNSASKAQDRYQVLPEWSNAKVRGEFDTLQLSDKNGNFNVRIPNSLGDKGKVPEPIANSYPRSTHGNGGGAQIKPTKNSNNQFPVIKYDNVTNINN